MEQTNDRARGSILGGALLIAGCCVGAGMLGVPVLTAVAGFKPSLLVFFLSWLFMMTTGLLLLEVNLWFGDRSGIVSMAQRTLGRIGALICWLLFLYLFYSVLVGYVVGSGNLLVEMAGEFLGLTLQPWQGSLLFCLLFGVIIYSGTLRVDYVNRILMAGLALTYLLLVGAGAGHVHTEYLEHVDWGAAVFVVPPLIISFGFHNLVPSITYYLGAGERKRLVWTVVIGSALPLLIYLLWQWLVLGLVPIEGGFREAIDRGEMATQVLRRTIGSSWVVTVADFFALFAIVTSLLSVALSFVEFLADGLKSRRDRAGRAILCVLTLIPPFLVREKLIFSS